MAFLATLVQLYGLLIFIRVMLTWIPNLDHSLTPVQILFQLTDPVLDFARRYIPPIGGVMDLSPTLVIIVLFFVARILSTL